MLCDHCRNEIKRAAHRPPISQKEEFMSEVLTVVCVVTDVHPQDVLSRSRKRITSIARNLCWVLIHELKPGITDGQIANFFQRERSNVSSVSKNMLGYIETEADTEDLYEQAKAILNDQVKSNQ